VQQSSRFNELDDKAKVILDDLITSRETLAQSLQEQEESNQRRHFEWRGFVESQHSETRTGVILAVNGAAASTDTQFQLMRKEIEIVGNTVVKNQQDILRILEEVNGLAQALAQAQSDKPRKKLQEGKNLAAETLHTLISTNKTLTVRRAPEVLK
jgi:hypothetical protein